jgi:hypothetical protein
LLIRPFCHDRVLNRTDGLTIRPTVCSAILFLLRSAVTRSPLPLEPPPRDALLLDLADWLDRSLPFWIALPLEDALPRKFDDPLLGLGAWLDRTLPV